MSAHCTAAFNRQYPTTLKHGTAISNEKVHTENYPPTKSQDFCYNYALPLILPHKHQVKTKIKAIWSVNPPPASLCQRRAVTTAKVTSNATKSEWLWQVHPTCFNSSDGRDCQTGYNQQLHVLVGGFKRQIWGFPFLFAK